MPKSICLYEMSFFWVINLGSDLQHVLSLVLAPVWIIIDYLQAIPQLLFSIIDTCTQTQSVENQLKWILPFGWEYSLLEKIDKSLSNIITHWVEYCWCSLDLTVYNEWKCLLAFLSWGIINLLILSIYLETHLWVFSWLFHSSPD